jgi:hypothetical protein
MSEADAEAVLGGHTPEVYGLVQWLRRAVKSADQDLRERVYTGWHGFGYHHPDAGYVCAVFPREDDVLLAFEHGANLADPEGRLTEGGKQVRSLVFTERSSHPFADIRGFVRAAVEDGVRRRQSGR